MFKKFTILFLLAANCVIYLPTQAAASAPADKTNSVSGVLTENLVLEQRRRRGRGRNDGYWDDRRGRRRSGSWYGYRNYGQYRRTQNRRSRYVYRTYWRNGRRYTRLVRIYY